MCLPFPERALRKTVSPEWILALEFGEVVVTVVVVVRVLVVGGTVEVEAVANVVSVLVVGGTVEVRAVAIVVRVLVIGGTVEVGAVAIVVRVLVVGGNVEDGTMEVVVGVCGNVEVGADPSTQVLPKHHLEPCCFSFWLAPR
jgi:hypothetical protein